MKVCTNKWMDRRKRGTVILTSIILPSIYTALSGLRTRTRYHNPLGSQFVEFFVCFSEEWERPQRHSAANLLHCFQISHKGNASTTENDFPMTEEIPVPDNHWRTSSEIQYVMFEILKYQNKSISQAELMDFKMQFQKSYHSSFKRWCAGFVLLNNQWIRLIPTFHMLHHYPSPLSVVASRDSSGQKS